MVSERLASAVAKWNQARCAYCGKFIDRNRPPEPVCDDYDCQKQHTEEMDASIRRHNAKRAKEPK